MQVVPATGAAEARRLGLPWGGADSLYDADTNIALGSAYLRKVLDKYGGKPYFAIAGYNAGPTPLQRWQSDRPGMDADFWIETITYKETREYVARVLAFSTIYRSEEHTSELQSLMRISYAVFCLKKKQ